MEICQGCRHGGAGFKSLDYMHEVRQNAAWVGAVLARSAARQWQRAHRRYWILRDEIGLGGIRGQSLTPKQVVDWRDALAKTTTGNWARRAIPADDLGFGGGAEVGVQVGRHQRSLFHAILSPAWAVAR